MFLRLLAVTVAGYGRLWHIGSRDGYQDAKTVGSGKIIRTVEPPPEVVRRFSTFPYNRFLGSMGPDLVVYLYNHKICILHVLCSTLRL